MPISICRIVMALLGGSLATLLLLAAPASAQSRVDCGNGYNCPADHACLLGGQCGRLVDAVPGSVRTSTGTWCDPGFREGTVRRGTCIPGSYSECASGMICPSGAQCSAEGRCTGGPAATGPKCGDARCAEGRICSSRGTCMNTAYFQDCGNGTICSKAAACEFPKGCALVAPERVRQQANRR
jgi:hypothetical protein